MRACRGKHKNDGRLAPLVDHGSGSISTEYRIAEHERSALAILPYGSGK
jgi:hypothetical protein